MYVIDPSSLGLIDHGLLPHPFTHMFLEHIHVHTENGGN